MQCERSGPARGRRGKAELNLKIDLIWTVNLQLVIDDDVQSWVALKDRNNSPTRSFGGRIGLYGLKLQRTRSTNANFGAQNPPALFCALMLAFDIPQDPLAGERTTS